MRWLIPLLLIVLGLLQYRIWVGEGSFAEVHVLREELDRQQSELAEMRERNAALRAEVESLRRGYDALEERARSELGMIKRGEVYLQLIEQPERGTRP